MVFQTAPIGAPAKRVRSFGMLALAAAVLGLLSVVLVPIIYVIGMISVIGIPVAMAAVVLPTIFMLIVLAYLLWRSVFFRFESGIALSFVAAIMVMLVVPTVYNVVVGRDVRSLMADDVSGPVAALGDAATLAVFKPHHVTDHCDEICADLLLSGSVGAYAAGRLPRGNATPGADATVLVHRLSRTPDCGKRQVSIRGEDWKRKEAGTVAQALAFAERQGICIASSQIDLKTLGLEQFVVFAGEDELAHRESVLFIDTRVRVSRASVYQRSAAGEFVPVHRETRVSYSLLQPLLAYGLSTIGDLSNVKSQWWRKSFQAERIDPRELLTRVFGVSLRRN